MTPRKNLRERFIYIFNDTLSDPRGFTLVELIVVSAIIGVLITIAIPLYSSNINKAKNVTAISDLKEVDREIQAYYMDNAAYPASLLPIKRDTLKDPWGTLYVYTPNPSADSAIALKGSFGLELNSDLDYDLYSKGSNSDSAVIYNAPKCDDDIVRASNGIFIGLRVNF
jgi:general secretion pathway protein G